MNRKVSRRDFARTSVAAGAAAAVALPTALLGATIAWEAISLHACARAAAEAPA